MQRFLKTSIVSAIVLGVAAPTVFADNSVTVSQLFKMSITVNGQEISQPYGVAQSDGSTTTTYLPMYYVDQALAKVGYSASWDGTHKVWTLTVSKQNPNFSSIQIGTGNTSIEVNGTVVKKINTVVETDPESGAATTYIPIYYVGPLLQAVGVTGTWNGTTHIWAISASTSGSSTTQLTAPTIQVNEANGSSSISVTNAPSGAVINLYTKDGTNVLSTAAGSDGSATFYNVSTGTYYVTATESGVTSPQSNVVTVGPSQSEAETPSIFASESNGTWYIDVNNTQPGATVTLYSLSGQKLGSTTANEYGHVTVNNVGSGTYYVIATMNGQSYQSNAISVNTSSSVTVSTPNLSVESSGTSIDASNVVPGATVTLYNSQGAVISSTSATSSGYATFSNVANGEYYAVQTWNGQQSGESNDVKVTSGSLPAPTLTTQAGNSSISVTGTTPGANVILYSSSGSIYAQQTSNVNGDASFQNVASGSYYADQSTNGEQSGPSNTVTVSAGNNTPIASISNNSGLWVITVNDVQPNAIVTLYTSSGSVSETALANSSGVATFSNVGQGTYYAKQTYDGVQSSASNQVSTNVSLPTPTLTTSITNGWTNVTVGNAQPNATVTLYYSNGDVYSTAQVTTSGTATFNAVPNGTFYAIQSFNGQQSNESNIVNVGGSLGAPTASVAQNNGSWTITVSGTEPNATVTLYLSTGTIYTSATANESGIATFNVPAGTYYATQTYNDVQSSGSNEVSTTASTQSKPSLTTSLSNGVTSITATGLENGATLTLYTSSGATYSTVTVPSNGTVTFNNVAGGTYYAIQTLNGQQSQTSNSVTVIGSPSVPAPNLTISESAGSWQVTASNVEPYAVVSLYNLNGTLYANMEASSNGSVTFTNVPVGSYYAIQTYNGQQSANSSEVST